MAILDDSCYAICAVSNQGFAVRDVNAGFCRLFGVVPADCVGKSIGDLAAEAPQGMGPLAEAAGLSIEQVAAGMRGITRRIESTMNADFKNLSSGDQLPSHFWVAIRHTKDGQPLVCELDVRVVTLPQTKWMYAVVFYKDISCQMSLREALVAAASIDNSPGHFDETVGRQWECSGRAQRALCSTPAVEDALNEHAAKMWRDLVAGDFLKRGDKKQRSSGQRSLASVSTTASSINSVKSFASARTAHSGGKSESENKLQESRAVGRRSRNIREHLLKMNPKENLFEDILIVAPGLSPQDECRNVARTLQKLDVEDCTIPFAILSSWISGHPIVAYSTTFAAAHGSDEDFVGRSWFEPSLPVKQLLDNSMKHEWLHLERNHPKVFNDHRFELSEGEWIEAGVMDTQDRSQVPVWYFYKQVELQHLPLVICLLMERGGAPPQAVACATISPAPQEVVQLSADVDTAMAVLAQAFWVTSSMRRQLPVGHQALSAF